MAPDVSQPTECKSCVQRREDDGRHRIRLITRLPIEVTQNSDFKKKGKPVYLCEYCDGDALDLAMKTSHEPEPED